MVLRGGRGVGSVGSSRTALPASAWGLRAPWAGVERPSYRTATVWKTLCPFWGEEYQVHLPPTFHAVAFYVMDEDALRCVGSSAQLGPDPTLRPSLAHFPVGNCWSPCSPFIAWREREPGGLRKGAGCERVCACVWLHRAHTAS